MKIKILLLAMACSVSLVGCTTQEQSEQNVLDTNQVQEQQKEESQKEDIQKEEVQTENVQNNQEQQKQEEDNNKSESNTTLNLYTVDVDDYSKVIPFENKTFTLQTNKDLEYNLQELCNTLKKEYFKDDNAGIEVVAIDENKIATINLTNEETWLKYFQGSAGAIITQETIVETLLQKEYQGDWIKGLKIQVDRQNGQEYDHVSFIEPFMR